MQDSTCQFELRDRQTRVTPDVTLKTAAVIAERRCATRHRSLALNFPTAMGRKREMSILSRIKIIVFIWSILAAVMLGVTTARADEPGCSQVTVDSGYSPPASAYYIYPRQTVLPFYQWENNNGYCGEVCADRGGSQQRSMDVAVLYPAALRVGIVPIRS
jgi:hypothetical protein